MTNTNRALALLAVSVGAACGSSGSNGSSSDAGGGGGDDASLGASSSSGGDDGSSGSQASSMDVFDGVLDIRNITQTHWSAITLVIGDDQTAILVGHVDLIVVSDGPLIDGVGKLAL